MGLSWGWNIPWKLLRNLEDVASCERVGLLVSLSRLNSFLHSCGFDLNSDVNTAVFWTLFICSLHLATTETEQLYTWVLILLCNTKETLSRSVVKKFQCYYLYKRLVFIQLIKWKLGKTCKSAVKNYRRCFPWSLARPTSFMRTNILCNGLKVVSTPKRNHDSITWLVSMSLSMHAFKCSV